MGDLGQQGLFDITRILLQQPDLAALSETLTGLVQQSALADRAAIILWHPGNHRAVRHACDDAGQPVSYEDETVLANGPVRRLLSRPDALHCDSATFAETWPQLAVSGLYPQLWLLLPAAAGGGRAYFRRLRIYSRRQPAVDRKRVPAAAHLYANRCRGDRTDPKPGQQQR